MIVVTYRNFEHFNDRHLAAVPAGGGGTVAAAPKFYFNPAAIPDPPRWRYEKKLHRSHHIRGSDLTPFNDAGLDMSYYVDVITGQYLFSAMEPYLN
jgi:hypothetical protein